MPGYGGFVPRHTAEPRSNTEADCITDRMCSTSRRTYRYKYHCMHNTCIIVIPKPAVFNRTGTIYYTALNFTVYIYTGLFQPVSIRCLNMLTMVHSQKQWPWPTPSTHSTKWSSRHTVTDTVTDIITCMHLHNTYHSYPNRNYKLIVATMTLITQHSVIHVYHHANCLSPQVESRQFWNECLSVL